MEKSKRDIPYHVEWDAIESGFDCIMTSGEADEIIEEIMNVLISKKLTRKEAEKILSETISSIDKEFVLERRKIKGEII